MSLRIPVLLDAILEATATEQGAKARIAGLRAVLEDEARRRYATEGAAPSWNTPKVGKVRFDPPGEWTATVADSGTFGSWVAEQHPTEVVVGVVVPSEHAEAAIEALTFAGIPHTAGTSVRSAWSAPWLTGLTVDVDEVVDGGEGPLDRVFTISDPTTGEVVPGLTATRAAGKLVVNLDPGRRTVALEEAKTEAEEVVQAATYDDGAGASSSTTDLDARRRELEGMPSEVLKAYAGRLDLGGSGTKPQLAERIARAEALTGRRELLTAATITDGPHGNGTTMTLGEALAVRDAPRGYPPLAVEHPAHEVRLTDLDDQGADAVRQIEESENHVPEPERGSVQYLQAQRAAQIEGSYPRETLRAFAKAKGIPAAGTKAQVAARIAAAGHTLDDLRLMHATQE